MHHDEEKPTTGAALALIIAVRPDRASMESEDGPDTVALELSPDGRLRIHSDHAADGGVLVSGVLGAALGILGGSPGWLLLGGGILERLADAAVAAGLDTRPLRRLACRFPLEAPVMLAVVTVDEVTRLHLEPGLTGTEVTVQQLAPVVVERTGLAPAVRYDAGDVDGDVIAIRRHAIGAFSHPTGDPGPANSSYRPDRE